MRISAILKGLIVVGVAGLCVATAAALLAPVGWPFELFAHFRLQYLVAGALLAAAALLGTRRSLALAALVATALNGVTLGGGTPVSAAAPGRECNGSELTVITANVEYVNRDHEALLQWLSRQSADVIVLEEVTEAWARTIERLPGYPFRAVRVREDPYGLALLSRRPLQSVEWLDFAADGIPTLGAQLEIDGQPVQIIGIHTHSPITSARLRARDRELERAAQRASYGGRTTVLLGDLNVSPDAPAFPRLLADGSLSDALASGGWRPTWRADFWPLALRIDHVLASPSLCVVSSEVGPDVGSDHRPVRATLRLPLRAPAPAG
jgi:endonuclease/exonuclease/phosphatase (EEP) superfamily protein YafD